MSSVARRVPPGRQLLALDRRLEGAREGQSARHMDTDSVHAGVLMSAIWTRTACRPPCSCSSSVGRASVSVNAPEKDGRERGEDGQDQQEEEREGRSRGFHLRPVLLRSVSELADVERSSSVCLGLFFRLRFFASARVAQVIVARLAPPAPLPGDTL